MDLTYTGSQLELKQRARELAESIMGYEDQCEAEDGLPSEALEMIKKSTLAAGLNAINMPRQWGGVGLSILDQVLVQEELGCLTNVVGHRLAAGQRAQGMHGRAARSVPAPGHQGRAQGLLRSYRVGSWI